MRLFKLWCEWDYGQDGAVFSSKSKAKEWFDKTIRYHHTDWREELGYEDEDEDDIFNSIDAAGLVGVYEVMLDPVV